VYERSSLFSILLVERGGCTFVKKVQEAEINGFAAVIVIDNVEWESPENIIMSDDGYGESISIPSMLVSKQQGDLLMQFLQTASLEEVSKQVVHVSFFIAAPDNHVEYSLWYTSSDDRSMDFLMDLAGYANKLGKYAAFTPHFVYWECFFCDQQLLEDNCWGGGRYCAVDTQNPNIKGIEIMTEDLR